MDVDITKDNPLYLDPYAIQIRNDTWSSECSDHIHSFFNELLDALRENNDTRATDLLSNLHEPNETFLGQSKGTPSGRGIGPDKATDLANALKKSRAFSTGLLSDISEAELFINNIGPDTISDLTTNVLRGLLVQYTIEQCSLYNIPTHIVTNIGPVWSATNNDWEATPLHLPKANNLPVLLVPKFSVRRSLSLNSQEFWNHHMSEFLKQEYLNNGSRLAKVFKTGKRKGQKYVTKKSVQELHPFIKDDLATFVKKHPEVLEIYKQIKGAKGPLDNQDFDENFDEAIFAQALSTRLSLIPKGDASANEYHNIMLGICTFLFYPHLIRPIKEGGLHQGRKRIDIRFTNAAQEGFFFRMLQSNQARALSVAIECKNYTSDIANPEFDQLTSRFGHQRGFFGIIACRDLKNRTRIISACRDAVNDGRGFMIVLEDSDFLQMLNFINSNQRLNIDRFLQTRFDEITH